MISTLSVLRRVASEVRGHCWGGKNRQDPPRGRAAGARSFDSLERRVLLNAKYSVADVGAALPDNFSEATGINNHGSITGYFGDGDPAAFVYENGKLVELGLNGQGGRALALNDQGNVVGWAYAAQPYDYLDHGFVFRNDKVTDVGSLGGDTTATGINDRGTVVGWSTAVSFFGRQAFIYRQGTIESLGTFGGTASEADAINDNGVVAVTVLNNDFAQTGHVILAKNGKTLASFGGQNSTAAAVNDHGQVAGYSQTTSAAENSTTDQAFLYSNGNLIRFGSTVGQGSQALGLNDHGQVVGTTTVSTSGGPRQHGFLYSGGKLIDLNTLLPANSGFTIVEATGINNKGQIAADADSADGQVHAVILTPQRNVR